MVKSKRVGYLVLATVFVLGVVVGGGAMLAWSQESHAAVLGGPAKNLPRYRVRALSRKLDLDRDQQARIAAILEDDSEVTQALGQDMVQRCGQRLREQKGRVDNDIRVVLHPEQQRRFDRLVDERRRKLVLPR
jgi:Spy/CpxP family protein refolding chaperone